MTFVWQEIIALALVTLAAAYLARQAYGALVTKRRDQGCGGACGPCAGKPRAPLVTLDRRVGQHGP